MRRLLLASFALVAMLIIACGGVSLIRAPEIIVVVMDSTSVRVTWEADPDIEEHEDFQGYNIYVHTDSTELLVEDGEDLNSHNAIVITDNFYTAQDLSQDSIYYIQVRTLNTEDKVGSYNADVPYVTASPRPEFTVTLVLEMFGPPGGGDSCAIRFSDATIMADSAMANGGADMWVLLWGMMPGDSVSFESPELHPQYGQNVRNTKFDNLGQYEFDDISEVTTEPVQDRVVISTGDLVIAMTQDSNYVKIHVDTIAVVIVTITYAYQNIAGFLHF